MRLATGTGLLLEGLVAVPLSSNEDFEPARKFLLNENSYVMINAFGGLPQGAGIQSDAVEP